MADRSPAAPRPGPPFPARLLALLLLTWVPASLALEASSSLVRLTLHGTPAFALLLARVLVAGLGIAAGRALWTAHPSALSMARAWLVLDVVVTALTMATPYFPSNRLPGTRWHVVALALAVNGAWLLYLSVSPGVRACWARD